ncbi:DUF4012 domain-containing protein [Microbacterium aerolatum]|uniref:DUF4012 domain-containing protein n=1 Tax=Microbacterium aerolatum TaxID=153731 RepID=UPI0020007EDB|nr:DUF4012 domain-containing protein [Microbacterium aerolatum]MCK3769748.1 DUF4012 domain-containing protein [Microbacterium aerolatum]
MSELSIRTRNRRALAAGRAHDHRERKHPRDHRVALWLGLGTLLGLVAVVVGGMIVGNRVYAQATAAKSSLEQALPLASTFRDQILSGDAAAARATVAQLAALTADARSQTDDRLWKSLEWLPVIGDDLHAIRVASQVSDDLATAVVAPAAGLNLDALRPVDGAVDIAAVTGMQAMVAGASAALDHADDDLAALDRSDLIPQLDGALTQLSDAVAAARPLFAGANEIIGVLPAALGADAPRNYLLVFQNNAESRSTGGIPAAFALVTADGGRLSVAQQASSADFYNERSTPIIDLDPGLEALFGDKVGRWIMDATMSPDFSESVDILRAYWAESFGTTVDAVVSFDPVALSYLLEATGPVDVPAGGGVVTISSDNAVQVLLHDAYNRFDQEQQDAFFAATARAVFDALMSGGASPQAIFERLTRAIDENRLMYSPASEEEARLIGDSKLSGGLPETNEDRTLVGVYVNDYTAAKMDYFMQLDITAVSTQCTAPDSPTFTTTATLTNTITREQVPGLSMSVDPPRFFQRGDVATYLVFYGPAGSTFTGATVDGKRVHGTVAEHLGRGAVKVAVRNGPTQTHTVTATFTGAEGPYGAFDLRHTPMVRPVGVQLTAEGCE